MKLLNKKQKSKDNMLVDICTGCHKKEQVCKCILGNVFKVYTSDIYLKKEFKKIIQDGVVSDLSGKEIMSNINDCIKQNSIVKQGNIFTNDFKVVCKFKSR